MSRTYRVCDRGELLGIGIPFFLLGMAFAVGGLLSFLGLPPLNTGEGSGNLAVLVIGAGVGGLAAFLGWEHLARRPWMITVDASGIVAFHRAFGVTQVRAADVVRIEPTTRRVGVEDGDSRELAIEHGGGTTRAPNFPEIDAFVTLVRTLNPSVQVTGSWGRGGRP